MIGRATNRKLADAFAAEVLPMILGIRAAGTTTMKGIAKELNARGVKPPSGIRSWHGKTVHRLLTRLNFAADDRTISSPRAREALAREFVAGDLESKSAVLRKAQILGGAARVEAADAFAASVLRSCTGCRKPGLPRLRLSQRP
jgi:hypothetical protein